MREKARGLWWKVTNPIRQSMVLRRLSSAKLGNFKLSRVLAWGGAAVVAIGLVSVAAIFLSTNNNEGTYAASNPPEASEISFSYARTGEPFGAFFYWPGTLTIYNNSSSTITVTSLVDGAGNVYTYYPGSPWGNPEQVTINPGGSLNLYGMIAKCASGNNFWYPALGSVGWAGTASVYSNGVDSVKYTSGYFTGFTPNYNTLPAQIAAPISITIDWDYYGGQPVNKSQAVNVDAGQDLQDQIFVMESEEDGTQITNSANSKWKTGTDGNKLNASFNVGVYGPFYDNQQRIPYLNSNECSDWGNKFYCSTKSTIDPSSLLGSVKMAVIGDGMLTANTQTAIKNSINNDVSFETVPGLSYNTSALTNTINSKLDGADYDYVVLALGASNVNGKSSAVTVNEWKNWINNVISTISSHGVSHILITKPYDFSVKADGTAYSSGDDLSTDIKQQSFVNFMQAMSNEAGNEGVLVDHSNVTMLSWLSAGLTVSSTYSNAKLDGCTSNGFLPSDTAPNYSDSLQCSNSSKQSLSGKDFYALQIKDGVMDSLVSDATFLSDAARWGSANKTTSLTPKATKTITTNTPQYSLNPTEPTTTVTYDNSSAWPAGTYYFVSSLSKSTDTNSWVHLDNWHSPFAENTEKVTTKINFGTTSNMNSTYVDPTKNQEVKDTLTIYPYKASSTVTEGTTTQDGEAKDAVSRYVDSNKLMNSNWPQSSINPAVYIPVNVCVTAYGPYNTPQSTQYQNTDLSDSEKYPKPANHTKCNDMIPEDSNGDIATTVFDFTDYAADWAPGYYYFVSSISKEDNGFLLGQTSAIQTVLKDDKWVSRFNPEGEKEWTFRQFQPFITSSVENADPWIDVKESNGVSGEGEEIIDRVIARAARSTDLTDEKNNNTAEATNGYQSEADLDTYWPKYSGGNEGKYIPVKFNFYICGPYQYPQDEGATNDMVNRTGDSATVCGSETALKVITKYVTPNSCSNDDDIDVILTENYTTDNTGAKSCAINFGRTYIDGDEEKFYQPGYYYFTSEMIKNQQTKYANISTNIGLDAETQISSFIVSDWQSKFNPLWKDEDTLPEIEWAYVQYQPIARSYAGATKGDDITDPDHYDQWTTKLSYQYEHGGYKGSRLICDEHKEMFTWADMINKKDFWDNVPTETLTCKNASDRVYLGSTTTKDVNYSTGVIKDDENDEKHWPKTNDSLSGSTNSGLNGGEYETIQYRVKLYGPFATVASATDGTLKSTPEANNEAGSTVTVVPSAVTGITVGEDSQPVAQSCLLSAKYGPNYNDFPAYNTTNPLLSEDLWDKQVEKTSQSQAGYYRAVFTSNPEADCAGGGNLPGTNPTNNPVLNLKPGIYISVVEVHKVDMNESNFYEDNNTDTTEDYLTDNGNEYKIVKDDENKDVLIRVDENPQTLNSADKKGQIFGGDTRDLMANDFHSKWADPYETLFVPPDTDIWTQRGGSTSEFVHFNEPYYDKYWATGWSDWYNKYEDILGNKMPNHSGSSVDQEFGYTGEDGYFAPDLVDTGNTPGKIEVTLYGSFGDSRPNTDTCPAGKYAGTWYVDAKDTPTGENGGDTSIPDNITLSKKGWYVYVLSYPGDDRVPPLQTKCSDWAEQFYMGDATPSLETKIDVKSENGKAPTVISDTVTVSGYIQKGSTVKLTLFKEGGGSHRPNYDTTICSVRFNVDEAGTYRVEDYFANEDGYIKSKYTPDSVSGENTLPNLNRCFADEAGHYYWYEEFYGPDGEELQQPRHNGKNEWVNLEKDIPEVTTIADSSAMVGKPFHDTAYVKIPEGDTKTYHLYMRAYGPTSGAPVCDTLNKTNMLFESGPHEVTKTGTYPSFYTSTATKGFVYWVETLIDPENPDEPIAEGYCGKALEITRVFDTPAPGSEWQWTAGTGIGAPAAGDIIISAASIFGLSGMVILGAWQLTDRNSWLLRRMNK